MSNQNSAISQMAWCDYDFLQNSGSPMSHWTNWAGSINRVDMQTGRFKFDVPRMGLRLDPLVLPYLAQVLILLDKFPDEAVHSLARQIDISRSCRDHVEHAFCMALLKRLAKPDEIIKTDQVRNLLSDLFAAMPEPWHGDRLRHSLRTDIERWLDRAKHESAKVAFISDFGAECTRLIQNYVDHVHGFLGGGMAHNRGLLIPVNDHFLRSVECQLNVISNHAVEFRNHCLTRIAVISNSGSFDRSKPLPYTAFKPLQYAVERLAISSLTSYWLNDPLLIRQARTTLETVFDIGASEAQSRLNTVLFCR